MDAPMDVLMIDQSKNTFLQIISEDIVEIGILPHRTEPNATTTGTYWTATVKLLGVRDLFGMTLLHFLMLFRANVLGCQY